MRCNTVIGIMILLALGLGLPLGCAPANNGNDNDANTNDNADPGNDNVDPGNDNSGDPTAKLTCVECHTSKDELAADLARRATDHSHEGGAACGGSVTRAGAVEAVFVNTSFLDTIHGQRGCTGCHGGVEPAADRDEAHAGDFSVHVDIEGMCGACHEQIVDRFLLNIHTKFNDLTPEDDEFVRRAAFHVQRVSDDPVKQQLMAEGIELACADCHRATCGSCHIVLPEPAGGGFPNGATGHAFFGTPNTVTNCGSCHGGRKAAEYIASDIPPALLDTEDLGEITLTTDIHYNPGNMKCSACHDFNWMHGQDVDYTTSLRHEDAALPTCEQCHVTPDEDAFNSANPYHSMHSIAGGDAPHLQCQVCHSQPYPNCASCHVSPTDTTEPPPDLKFYTFKIARNPFTNAAFYLENYPALGQKRPYEYSVVRRPSIVIDTFDAFADGVLENFTDYPTWKYATPHNIQKFTLATADGCGGCHDNDNFYLTEGYLRSVFTEDNFPGNSELFIDSELSANQEILIER